MLPWQQKYSRKPVLCFCSCSSLLSPQQQTLIFQRPQGALLLTKHKCQIASTNTFVQCSLSSGTLHCAAPLGSSSELLAIFWHPNQDWCLLLTPLWGGFWSHISMPQEAEKKLATTQINLLHLSPSSPSPLQSPFHGALITSDFAKSSILKILLFHLHCPNFLFC